MGTKVAGHASLSRSGTVFGAVVNTNSDGYGAFMEAKSRAARTNNIENELAELKAAFLKLTETIG